MDALFPSALEIEALMNRVRSTRIGVLGDFCLDAYFEIDSGLEEYSIETGKRVQHVRRQRYSPGGAGNVVVNLLTLGVGHVEVLGAVGQDLFGREMARLFTEAGVGTNGLITQADRWDTPVYGKPLLDSTEQQRLDFGAWNQLSSDSWEQLKHILQHARDTLDFLVVNQQLPHGWCDDDRADWVCNEARTFWPGKHLVDARHFVCRFKGAALKVNQDEAANLLGEAPPKPSGRFFGDDEALAMARQLCQWSDEPQTMTRGEVGMIACTGGHILSIPGVQIVGPTDTVGAGDTSTAMLAAARASGASPEVAAVFANLAASVTVQKLNQTGTASEQELGSAAEKLTYVYHPTLAAEPRRAHYLPDTDIELVDESTTTMDAPIRVALFDHDGTISTLRQGWEDVMEPVMIRAILGDRYQSADSATFSLVQQRVRAYIEQSTGIQTISQMDALVRMVDDFNLVPPDQRLDAWGYKAVYNQALMQMVDDRLQRLERGELDHTDFIIKGAVSFLQAMRSKGIRLYLVSGTDEADTIHEATLLGYADIFDGRIYGAKPGSRADTKEDIIRTVLESLGGSDRFVVFGDGPVEIRLGHRFGGLACGVASNEERRFGLNLVKRRRLIRAGAHLLVPDFAQWQKLSALLSSDQA